MGDIQIIGQNWLWTGPPGCNPADVNGDGVVNMADVILVGQHWLQTVPVVTSTPASTGSPTGTPTITQTATASATNTASPTPTSLAVIADQPTTLSLLPGQSASFDVAINSDAGVMGYEFGLQFDPSVVQVTNVTSSSWLANWGYANGASTVAFPWAISNSAGTVSVGSVTLAGSTGSGPSGNGTLATVDVIGIGPGSATVAVTSLEVFTRIGTQLVPFWTQNVTNGQVTVTDPTATSTPTITSTASATLSATSTATVTATATPILVTATVPPSFTPLASATVPVWTFTPRPTITLANSPTPVPSAVPGDATLSIEAPAGTVLPGQDVTLNVMITSDVPVNGVQFGLTFDPTIVSVTSVNPGTFLSDWAALNGASVIELPPWAPDNIHGSVYVGALSLVGEPINAGPSGSGLVATIVLHTLASGSTSIAFTSPLVATPDWPYTSTVANLTVSGVTLDVGSGSVTPTPTITPAPQPTATAVASGSGTLGFGLDAITLQAGQTEDIPILGSANVGVSGGQFGLSFDPTVIQVNSVRDGPWLDDWAAANGGVTIDSPGWAIDNVHGYVTTSSVQIYRQIGVGPTVPGTLAYVNVTALQSGSTLLDLSNPLLDTVSNGSNVPIPNLTVTLGELIVSGSAGSSPTVSPTPTAPVLPTYTPFDPTPTGFASATPIGTYTPTPVGSNTPTLAGTFAPTPTPTSNPAMSPSATATVAPGSPTPTLPATFTLVPTNTARPTITPVSATPTPSTVPGNGTLSIPTPTGTVSTGQTVTLQVMVSSDVPVIGTQFGLTFDPTIVQITSVTDGTFFSNWTATNGGFTLDLPGWTVDNVHGVVAVSSTALLGAPSGQGPTGSGVLSTITLNTVGNGLATLAFAQPVVDSPNAAQEAAPISNLVVTNGQLQIGPVTPTAVVSPTSTASPTSADPPTVSATPTLAATASSTPTAMVSPMSTDSPTAAATAPPTVTGSVSPVGTATNPPTLTSTATGTSTPTSTPSGFLSFSPADATPNVGDTFTVDVQVSTSEIDQGLQFGFTFNPQVVAVVTVVPGTLYTNYVAANSGTSIFQIPPFGINNTTGTVSAGALTLFNAGKGGPSGAGTGAVITFQALAAGHSDIVPNNVTMSVLNANGIPDQNATFTATSGAIDVLVNGSTSTPSPTPTGGVLTATPTATSTVATSLTASASPTTAATPSATASPSGSPTGTVVSTASSTPLATASPTGVASATLSPSPSPTPTISATVAGTFTIVPTNTPLPTTTPSSATPTPATVPGNGTLSIATPTGTVSAGQTVTLNVMISSDVPVIGAQFGLTFDPTLVQITSVVDGTYFSNFTAASGGSTLDFPGWTPDNTHGSVSVSSIALLGAPSGQGPTGSGVLATITLNTVANGLATLTFTQPVVESPNAAQEAAPISNLVVTNGELQIGPASPTAIVSSTSTASPTVTPTVTGTPPTSTPTVTGTPPTATPTGTATVTVTPTINGNPPTFTSTATGSPTPTATPVGSLSFSPADATPNIGDTLNVNVQLDTGSQINQGFQFGFSFNPQVVKVVTVVPGSLYTTYASGKTGVSVFNSPSFAIDNTGGTVSVGGISLLGQGLGGPTGTGTGAVITFQALAAGHSDITPNNVQMTVLDPQGAPFQGANFATTKGAIDVSNVVDTQTSTPTSTGGAGTSTPTSTPTPSYTPSYTPTWTATTNPTASYTPTRSVTPTGTITPTGSPTVQLTYTPRTYGTAGPTPTTAGTISGSASLEFSVPSQTFNPGDTITIDVNITCSVTCNGFQFGFTYDKTIIGSVTVAEGTFLKNWASSNGAQTLVLPPWNDDGNGTVSVGAVALTGEQADAGPTGSGQAAQITAKAVANGTSALTFQTVVITGPSGQISEPIATTTSPASSVSVGVAAAQSATAAATASGTTVASATPTLTPANGLTATAQVLTSTAQATLAGSSTPTLTPANGLTATAQVQTSTAQATLAGPSTPTLTPANAASATAQAVAATKQATAGAGQALNGAAAGGANAAGTPGAPGSTDSGSGNGAGGSGDTSQCNCPNSGTDNGSGAGASGGDAGPGGATASSAPSNRVARIDLTQYIDDKGQVHQEIRAADKSNTIQVLIPINTTALSGDKRPLQTIDVSALTNHPVTADNQFVIGAALELQPSGATFSPPITIGISYDPAKLTNGITDGDLAIGFFDTAQGKWVMLDSAVDAQSHVVTAKTSHFTTFAVLNKPPVSINWWLLLAVLLVEAAAAIAVYWYIRRRRRLAALAAEVDDEEEGEPFVEEEGYDEWRFRRGANGNGGVSAAIALLKAPTRPAENVVEAEFEEDGTNGASPSVNGLGDHARSSSPVDEADEH
jgi:hypothetical protein